ncbi:MAG TPA: methyl-accepting chemotaxis protein [Anoxybacillus sp.]|nr:methyl-accepting chemotaxis protein [Anoxybacillus sp.]
MNKRYSLKRSFFNKIASIILIISVLSSIIQLYFIRNQLNYEIENQTSVIEEGIKQGINETELASKEIEKQIDLKMYHVSKYISNLLNTNSVNDINSKKLDKLKEELGLAGITIFTEKDDDIIAVMSTDKKDLGMSAKSYKGLYEGLQLLLHDQSPPENSVAKKNNFYCTPIIQSGQHDEEKLFFKYAYYHPPGADYIINPFVEANEVYKFTEKVGPQSWIDKMLKENKHVKEIAILDPEVFVHPDLENQLYPPRKKIVYGTFKYKSDADIDLIKKFTKNQEKVRKVEKINGKKYIKVFAPIKNGQVIYLALDYNAITGPMMRHSIILIISGLVSLMALFFFTARFFNKIYENIQKIKKQIHSLEAGDLTAKSDVHDNTELQMLSESANRMVDTLHQAIGNANQIAVKTQRLAYMLEEEASKSVEQMYSMSTEKTIESREQLEEALAILNAVEKEIANSPVSNKEELFQKLELLRKIAHDRTYSTTEMTITLSDLMQSLHRQSEQLTDISETLLKSMERFKL